MPNYVTITPKYQVIDLADMLKVPEMITRETKEANKEIEDYKDQISKNRALLGPDADKIFSPYDDLMNALIDNPTVADRQNIANQLRNRYRDINAKVEAAKPKYDKMAEMFMQHPDYIGNPGSFMDYYNNPNYTPTVVDGAKIATDSAKAMKAFVAKMMPKRIGTLEGDKTKDVYGKGYTPDELSAFVDDAVSGRLQTPEGRTLASILEKNGYGNLQTDAERVRAQNYLKQGVAEGFMTTDILPNATEQAKLNARYSGSRSSGSGSRGTRTYTKEEKYIGKYDKDKNDYIKTKYPGPNDTGYTRPPKEYQIKVNANGQVVDLKSRNMVWDNKNKSWVRGSGKFEPATAGDVFFDDGWLKNQSGQLKNGTLFSSTAYIPYDTHQYDGPEISTNFKAVSIRPKQGPSTTKKEDIGSVSWAEETVANIDPGKTYKIPTKNGYIYGFHLRRGIQLDPDKFNPMISSKKVFKENDANLIAIRNAIRNAASDKSIVVFVDPSGNYGIYEVSSKDTEGTSGYDQVQDGGQVEASNTIFEGEQI